MILRSLFFVFVLAPYLLVGVPCQFVVVRLGFGNWHALPRGFHKLACKFLGLHVTLIGRPQTGKPTLLVSNHIAWTDIVALASVADVTFVAKSEIARWPVVGFMAGLQKTIYVDRNRRSDARRTSGEMARRIADGDAVLLFAEGQSDTGTHVLPFRSALVGAAQLAMRDAGAREVALQPVTIAYTKLQGMPVSRNERSFIAWAKSRSKRENFREILGGGTKHVTIAFGAPQPLVEGADRKMITKAAECEVRKMLIALNRGHQLPAVHE